MDSLLNSINNSITGLLEDVTVEPLYEDEEDREITLNATVNARRAALIAEQAANRTEQALKRQSIHHDDGDDVDFDFDGSSFVPTAPDENNVVQQTPNQVEVSPGSSFFQRTINRFSPIFNRTQTQTQTPLNNNQLRNTRLLSWFSDASTEDDNDDDASQASIEFDNLNSSNTTPNSNRTQDTGSSGAGKSNANVRNLNTNQLATGQNVNAMMNMPNSVAGVSSGYFTSDIRYQGDADLEAKAGAMTQVEQKKPQSLSKIRLVRGKKTYGDIPQPDVVSAGAPINKANVPEVNDTKPVGEKQLTEEAAVYYRSTEALQQEYEKQRKEDKTHTEGLNTVLVNTQRKNKAPNTQRNDGNPVSGARAHESYLNFARINPVAPIMFEDQAYVNEVNYNSFISNKRGRMKSTQLS